MDVEVRGPSSTHSGWKATLAAISLSQFTAKFGFAFATPFVPLFLYEELHIRGTGSLAFWSGVVTASTGLGVVVASPIWGTAADRVGRKPMLLRAMVAGAAVMGLTALVQSPLQFAAARFALGSTAGTTAAASALIASETPPQKMSKALGILASAMALGQALGPVTGGFLAVALGLRKAFVVGGALVAVPVLPLLAVVRERHRPVSPQKFSLRRVSRELGPAGVKPLLTIIGAQGLLQFAFVGTQQLIVIKLVGISARNGALSTGITFLVLGVSMGIAAAGYSLFFANRIGLRKLAVATSVLMAVSIAGLSWTDGVGSILAVVTGFGLTYGVLNPCLYSMVGLASPAGSHATFFGLNASAGAVGQTLGPLITGIVAALAGIPAGLAAAAVVLVITAALLRIAATDPGVQVDTPIPVL